MEFSQITVNHLWGTQVQASVHRNPTLWDPSRAAPFYSCLDKDTKGRLSKCCRGKIEHRSEGTMGGCCGSLREMPRVMPLVKDAIKRCLQVICGAVMGGATLIGRWYR